MKLSTSDSYKGKPRERVEKKVLLWADDKADAVKQQGDCTISSPELMIIW